ncbi:MAG: glycosyltransferase [Bacteroidales bacterium]|nr:glycosyltransferase [Bacteroidales bacterium]
MMIFFVSVSAVYFLLVLACCVLFFRCKTPETKDFDIKISVLVSAKNEEENIGKFLRCIENQSFKNFTLVLIDDNSTDSTFEKALNFGLKNLVLKKNPFSGKKSALKYGMEFCSGEYVFLTDADCFPEKDWLKTLVSTMKSQNADMVLSPVVITAPDSKNRFQRLWQAEGFSFITVTAGTCVFGQPVMSNGGNIGYRTEFFKDNILGLNTAYSSGDDMFMLETAQKMNKKIVYSKLSASAVETFGVETMKELFNQRSRWVSKTGGYRRVFTLFFAAAVFFANIDIIVLTVLSAFGITDFWLLVAAFFSKFFVDFLSVKIPSTYYNRPQKFSDIFLLALVYPYYVFGAVFMYFFKGFKWK